MAKRYDQETKDEVVTYVETFNKENGRGGQTAAATKYKLSPITIAQWLKKAGVATGGKKNAAAKPAKVAKSATPKKTAKATAVTGSDASILKRMLEVQTEIESLQAEYAALKGKL